MSDSLTRLGRRGPTIGTAVGSILAATAWVVGTGPLSDNSFLTHLATGRIILESGAIPSTDPYTFTALGEPWVVQSWLASLLYSGVEALAGGWGLRALMGLTMAAIAGIGWALTRPAPTLLVRIAIGGLFLLVAAGLWSERPLLLGLLALGIAALTAEGRLPAPLLLPVGWFWVNSHGSFPLGIVYLIVVAVGSRLDGATAATELAALRWLVAGVVVGAAGPLGLQALTFPVELLQRQDVLQHVNEWRAPSFTETGQRAFLLQLLLAVGLLARRPSYRSVGVIIVFGGAALLGTRNVPVASLLLLPGMAMAAPGLGTVRSTQRGPMAAGLTAVAAIAAAVLGGARSADSDFDLSAYPVAALAALEQADVDLDVHRLAAPDVVGNLREAIYGPSGDVFSDDRFDMFPAAVLDDQVALNLARPSAWAALDRHEIDLVIWPRTGAVAQRLVADPTWGVIMSDERWVLLCRRESDAGLGAAAC